MVSLYHYLVEKKWKLAQSRSFLKPSAPFNSRVSDEEWEGYTKKFSFPLARFYTCTFFEPKPESWIKWGLFDLLMEEFSGGDRLLRLNINDNTNTPIIVRDHSYHSPKAYNCSPDIWRKRHIRNSRPDLRKKWYSSAVPLYKYNGDFMCPEVLIPFDVSLKEINIEP